MFSDEDVWRLAARWQRAGYPLNPKGVERLIASGKYRRLRRCRSLRRAIQKYSLNKATTPVGEANVD